jgi:hypothetical protein
MTQTDPKPSKHALKGEIIKISKGLAIYQTHASPYWFARIRDPISKRNIVRSTKETSRLEARKLAEELFLSILKGKSTPKAPREMTFGYFAEELVKVEKRRGEQGELHAKLWANTEFYLGHKKWGILERLDKVDIRTITTVEYIAYMDWVRTKDKTLKPATRNHITSTFSKVLKLARDRGAILTVPDLPRAQKKDNPRPFFRFYPLVPKEEDEYKILLAKAKDLAIAKHKIRESVITDELYDLILFLTHSFVRPIESEFYALKHKHVSVASEPRCLTLTISDGKTGYRVSSSMPAAVGVYKRIAERYPDLSGPDDYLFFPGYRNRSSAKRIAQRQFNELLKACELKQNPVFEYSHSLYSLRHTALCMRLTLSKGKVNIYTLAKNAGTSVNQIERFYARHLPLSGELVRNLQTFGEE